MGTKGAYPNGNMRFKFGILTTVTINVTALQTATVRFGTDASRKLSVNIKDFKISKIIIYLIILFYKTIIF